MNKTSKKYIISIFTKKRVHHIRCNSIKFAKLMMNLDFLKIVKIIDLYDGFKVVGYKNDFIKKRIEP